MLRLKAPSARVFDFFRTQFGIYAAILLTLLLGDRSLGVVFGAWMPIAASVGAIAGVFWALNVRRRAAAVVYLICLAIIVEADPSALRVVPGYIGWIFFASLFIPSGEGCRLRKQAAVPDWKMPLDIYAAIVLTLAFSFTFSGATKLLSPLWLEGVAIEAFFSNPRFNWTFLDILKSSSVFTSALTYLTIGIELLFLPLYLIPRTRKLAWTSLFTLFSGMLVLMRIPVVVIGMLSTLVLLYVPSGEEA